LTASKFVFLKFQKSDWLCEFSHYTNNTTETDYNGYRGHVFILVGDNITGGWDCVSPLQ